MYVFNDIMLCNNSIIIIIIFPIGKFVFAWVFPKLFLFLSIPKVYVFVVVFASMPVEHNIHSVRLTELYPLPTMAGRGAKEKQEERGGTQN
jgi:hypothetical protein